MECCVDGAQMISSRQEVPVRLKLHLRLAYRNSLDLLADVTAAVSSEGELILSKLPAEVLSALPLQAHSFTKAVLSQVVSTGDVFTGVVIGNPGHETAEVTVDVYTRDGTMTGREIVYLNAGRTLFRLLQEVLPSTVGQIGGSIQIESARPILAYQSFGDYDLDFLSTAIPTVLQ